MKKLLLFTVLMLALSYVSISQSSPQTPYYKYTWKNAVTTGAWTDPANWTTTEPSGTYPGGLSQNVDVIFKASATNTTIVVTGIIDVTIDGLFINKNGSAGMNVTFKALSDGRDIFINGNNSAHKQQNGGVAIGDFCIDAYCSLNCYFDNNTRTNIICKPGVQVWLRSSSGTNGALFETAHYITCDDTHNTSLIDARRNPSNPQYYRNKGFLLQDNGTKRAEMIQETDNQSHVHGWVEWSLPYKSPVVSGKENYHLICPPTYTDLPSLVPPSADPISCCLTTGDVLHECNDLNELGAPLQSQGYMVRTWNQNSQNYDAWMGAYGNSCDAALNLNRNSNNIKSNTSIGYEVYTLPGTHQSYRAGDLWYGPLNTSATTSKNILTITHTGWALFGNPFPSAIKAGEVSGGSMNGWYWNETYVQAWIYMWDGSNYRMWNWSLLQDLNFPSGVPVNLIPSGNGFFVKVDGVPPAGEELKLDNVARYFYTDGAGLITKTAKVNNLTFTLAQGDNNLMDQARIYFNDNATGNYNGKYDGSKLFRGSDVVGELYIKTTEGSDVAIKAYKPATGTVSSPLYFNVGATGTYTITASDLSSFSTRTAIQLLDKKTNQTIDLKANPVYTFSATNGDDPYRFDVLFTDVLNGVVSNNENPVKIYSAHSSIFVVNNTNNDLHNADVTICDMIGREVYKANITSGINEVTKINGSFNRGFYIVTVRTSSNVFTQKLYIE